MNPPRIDKTILSQYEEYRLFINQENSLKTKNVEEEKTEDITPEENIDKLYQKINEQLSEDLLEIIMEKDPYYFERLVIDILKRMGYGDLNSNTSNVTPKTRDEGIDGIINQDKLGLEKIYIQAKRWTTNIGRPALQQFAGAISGKKGIFITTSDFTQEAKEFANGLSNIVLINGKDLTKYMIEYNVGVQTNYSYEIKKIDNDYFEMI